MAQLKGFAIRGLLKYAKENKPGSIGNLLAALSPETRKSFDKPIQISQWYPYPVFSELLRQIDKQLGKGDLQRCADVGEFAARQDIAGIFKVMMSMLTPQAVVARGNLFWSKYSDTGKVEQVPAGDHKFAIRIVDFPMIDEAHCFLMIGWIRRWGLMTRAAEVLVDHKTCVRHGGPFCQWDGGWRD